MIKSNESIDYIGDELELFKKALNWKNYFSKKFSKSVHGDILEVGAGIGVNTKFLARNPEKISSWTLIEPDEKISNSN